MSDRLENARLYLVAPVRLAAGLLAELVPELAQAGVDVVQLRAKELEPGGLVALGEPVAAACRTAGVPFVVNDRPDVAVALRADGVHLGQDDLPVDLARRVLRPGIVGSSNHSAADIGASLALGVDYLSVGPVYETPTKPGRPAAGLTLIEHAAAAIPSDVPWFAIGGIDADMLPEVLGAGATRIAVVRAVTEAPDPAAAAALLRAMLPD